MQTPADPKDQRSSGTTTIESTALEIQNDRGIIYVYRRDGAPLLKITGLPTPVPDLDTDPSSGHQLTIHIVSPAADAEREAYLGALQRSGTRLADDAAGAGSTSNSDAEVLLKQAGATVMHPERTD
jgi:hypothetical protein